MTPSLTLTLLYVILLANWVLLETPKRGEEGEFILCNTRGSITIEFFYEKGDMYKHFAYIHAKVLKF